MKGTRLLLMALIISTVLLSAACSQSRPVEEVGLDISNWSIALGAVDNNMDKTRVSYNIDISNKYKRDIYVRSLEIVTGDKINGKILGGIKDINLNKTIKADEVAQIKGEIIIDTRSMNKEQISDLAPFVIGIKVVSEETIFLK